MLKVKLENSGATSPTMGGGKNKGKRQQSTANNFLRAVGFSVSRDGPELYLKTIERLGLYVSMQLKKGSDIKICLMQKKSPQTQDSGSSRWAEIIKTEQVLEGNLRNLFTVLMSLCDSDTKNQVEASPEYKTLEMTLDSMGLLSIIKRLVYTGGTNNLNVWHNKAMAIMDLMTLYQEKFQDIQDFRDQYTAMKKECDELGLKFGRCEDDTSAMLKEKDITELTTAQLNYVTNKVEEEPHAILFLYKTDKSRYGKFIEETENDVLQRKEPFLKMVTDTCRVLEGWKNRHGNKDTRFTEANNRQWGKERQ